MSFFNKNKKGMNVKSAVQSSRDYSTVRNHGLDNNTYFLPVAESAPALVLTEVVSIYYFLIAERRPAK